MKFVIKYFLLCTCLKLLVKSTKAALEKKGLLNINFLLFLCKKAFGFTLIQIFIPVSMFHCLFMSFLGFLCICFLLHKTNFKGKMLKIDFLMDVFHKLWPPPPRSPGGQTNKYHSSRNALKWTIWFHKKLVWETSNRHPEYWSQLRGVLQMYNTKM